MMSEDPQHADDAARALWAGIRFLEHHQCPGGDFPVYIAHSADMSVGRAPHACLYGAALVVVLLHDCTAAAALCERAADFIEREAKFSGLWEYFRSDHRHPFRPPTDVDDTALASHALAAMGRQVPNNRSALLGNRDRHGMFFTWILPWGRPLHWSLAVEMLRQLRWLRAYRRCYEATMIERDDVDAGINANVLAWLGEFDGDGLVFDRLLRIVRDKQEAWCDRYYDNPVLIRFLFSRALVGRCPEAGELLVARAEVAADADPLDVALTILTRATWGAPVPEHLKQQLIAGQRADGSWPIAPLYCGGRERLGYLRFGPTAADRWRRGAEAYTTSFAVAALNAVTPTAAL
jgi:hypothetical protein